jgi:hypothetical protein
MATTGNGMEEKLQSLLLMKGEKIAKKSDQNKNPPRIWGG